MGAKVGAKERKYQETSDSRDQAASGEASNAAEAPPKKGSWLVCFGRAAFFIVCLVAAVLVVSLGYLQMLAEWIGTLGVGGHFVVVLLLMLMGLPVAWGFSVILASAGYLYGWKAVPACEFGCLLGALFGFLLSRGTQKEAVKRQIASLPQKRQEQVHALLGGLTTRRAGLLLFASMRMTPLLTFGWVNGIAGALTDVPVALFALASMMGVQMDICTRIYVGNTLRLATDAAEGSGGGNATADGGGNHTGAGAGAGAGAEDPARIPLLIVQICMLLIVLIVPTVVGNRILKRMLAERAQAEAQAAAPASVDMTPTRASGPVAVATPPSSAAPAPASGTSDPRV